MSKIARSTTEQRESTGGDWMYILVNSKSTGTHFYIDDVIVGEFSLYYMPLFDPQGSLVFGDCDGSWRINSVRFSELRLWTVHKTPA